VKEVLQRKRGTVFKKRKNVPKGSSTPQEGGGEMGETSIAQCQWGGREKEVDAIEKKRKIVRKKEGDRGGERTGKPTFCIEEDQRGSTHQTIVREKLGPTGRGGEFGAK